MQNKLVESHMIRITIDSISRSQANKKNQNKGLQTFFSVQISCVALSTQVSADYFRYIFFYGKAEVRTHYRLNYTKLT